MSHATGVVERHAVVGAFYSPAACERSSHACLSRFPCASRPEVAVVIDPVSWWHYAFTVVVEKLRAERCWRAKFPDIVKRRKLR